MSVIGVVGNQFAGKSHFLTAACREIIDRQRLAKLGFGSAEALVGTASRFYHQRSETVFREHRALPRTQMQDGLTASRNPVVIKIHHGFSSHVVLLHDVPGEMLMNEIDRRRHLDFLSYIDGLILLIDPVASRALCDVLRPTVDQDHFNDGLLHQGELINSLARDLGQERARILPVSAVVTKGDLVEMAVGPIDALDRPEAESVEEIQLHLREIDKAVQSVVLPALDDPRLVNAVSRFEQAIWHLVSPLGVLPETDGTILGEIVPRRVIDPIYRILRSLPDLT